MADFDYESLLDRARENIPEEISSRSRWRLPAPQILIEGSNTIFRNFNDVVSMMDRDENHVYQYILNDLGTSGSRDCLSSRIMFKLSLARQDGRAAPSGRSCPQTKAWRVKPGSFRPFGSFDICSPNFVNRFGQAEVLLRDGLLIMCHQFNDNIAPAKMNVCMVLVFLAEV